MVKTHGECRCKFADVLFQWSHIDVLNFLRELCVACGKCCQPRVLFRIQSRPGASV